MNGLLVRIIAVVALVLALNGIAGAEVVNGKIKAIAGESKLFTFASDQGEVIFIAWDNKTAWNGISNSADLKPGEALSVDFRRIGEIFVAGSVSRHKTPVPAGMKVITLEQLLENLAGTAGSHPVYLLDTRPTEHYDAGHIPGAQTLPSQDLKKRLTACCQKIKRQNLFSMIKGRGGRPPVKLRRSPLESVTLIVQSSPTARRAGLSPAECLLHRRHLSAKQNLSSSISARKSRWHRVI